MALENNVDYEVVEKNENSEKNTEKIKLEKQKEEDLKYWEKIFISDSEKTENIIDKNINNIKKIEEEALSEFEVWNQFFDFHNKISEKIDRFETDVKSKLSILNNATMDRYNELLGREVRIEDWIQRLKKLKEKKVIALENEKKALDFIQQNKWFFEKLWDKAVKTAKTVWKVWVWIWTLWWSVVAEKVFDKYFSEEWKSKRDIDKIEDLEERFATKLETIRDEKSKIEDLINTKKKWRDEIEWYIWWMFEWIWIIDDKKEELINQLKDWESEKVLEEISKLDINKKTKNILIKSIKLFDKKTLDEFKEFDKSQRVMENKDKYLEELRNRGINKKDFEDFNEKLDNKDYLEIKLENKILNWKKFWWNYEWKKIILKDWKEKFLFIEKWEKNKEVDWSDKSTVLIFDEDEWFVEVNDKFLELKENKKIKEKIEERIKVVENDFKEKIRNTILDLKKNKDILNNYKKFADKFDYIGTEFKINSKAFEWIQRDKIKEEAKKVKKEEEEKIKKIKKENWIQEETDLRTWNESLI